MKTIQIIIILIVGFVGGYLVRMYVHQCKPAEPVDNTPIANCELKAETDTTKINSWIRNYKGESRYYYLDDNLLCQLNLLKENYAEGTGAAIYFGREGDATADTAYDCAILFRTDGLNGIEGYYKVSTDRKHTGLCPYICDIVSPLPTNPSKAE